MNERQALNFFRADAVDLLITDLNMLGMNMTLYLRGLNSYESTPLQKIVITRTINLTSLTSLTRQFGFKTSGRRLANNDLD